MRYTSTLLLAATLLAGSATAQDKIRLRNGSITEAKVVEVGPREVTYKRWDNKTGPDYRINRGDVLGIDYENGSTEDLGRSGATARPQMDYGRNILSLAPIQFTTAGIRGVGLYYERRLDSRGILALQLPLVLSFPDNFRSNNGYSGVFTHLFPGLKIYPRGNRGVVKYALGPSLALGFGQRSFTGNYYDPITGQTQFASIDEDVFYYGVMVNNSLNISPSPHLYLGLEFGLGIKYTNSNSSNYYYNYDDPTLINFNFKIGYRF